MNTGTLTPEGAQLLRGARDAILADPTTFDMAEWDCGTQACIAGHIARRVPALVSAGEWSTRDVSAALGFGDRRLNPVDHPLYPLFFSWRDPHDAAEAAARINEFLWNYGYPATAAPGEAVCSARCS